MSNRQDTLRLGIFTPEGLELMRTRHPAVYHTCKLAYFPSCYFRDSNFRFMLIFPHIAPSRCPDDFDRQVDQVDACMVFDGTPENRAEWVVEAVC